MCLELYTPTHPHLVCAHSQVYMSPEPEANIKSVNKWTCKTLGTSLQRYFSCNHVISWALHYMCDHKLAFCPEIWVRSQDCPFEPSSYASTKTIFSLATCTLANEEEKVFSNFRIFSQYVTSDTSKELTRPNLHQPSLKEFGIFKIVKQLLTSGSKNLVSELTLAECCLTSGFSKGIWCHGCHLSMLALQNTNPTWNPQQSELPVCSLVTADGHVNLSQGVLCLVSESSPVQSYLPE